FARPVIVPRAGAETVRVAALAREDGTIDLALRAAASGWRTDHFTARWRPGAAPLPAEASLALEGDAMMHGRLPLEPGEDLYGPLLFQRGRFQRLAGYRWLRATECAADIAADGAAAWFGRWLPGTLVLGDPGARDAALHAVQACIPHRVLLPIGVDRIECA